MIDGRLTHTQDQKAEFHVNFAELEVINYLLQDMNFKDALQFLCSLQQKNIFPLIGKGTTKCYMYESSTTSHVESRSEFQVDYAPARLSLVGLTVNLLSSGSFRFNCCNINTLACDQSS